MKKIIIFLVILPVIGIGIVFGIVTGVIPLNSGTPPVDEIQPSSPANSPVPSTAPKPSPIPSSPTPSVPSSQNGEVKFELAVADIIGSGLSRTITSQVTNSGAIDVHNVWGKVEVFSQDSIIKLGGEESLRIDVGTVNSGETVATEVTLNFGLTDGLKISQNGATVVLTIYSDEVTETFSYDYSP